MCFFTSDEGFEGNDVVMRSVSSHSYVPWPGMILLWVSLSEVGGTRGHIFSAQGRWRAMKRGK